MIMNENILREMIIEECGNDFHNLYVYVRFNPNNNIFHIYANQDVAFTKNKITHWIHVICFIDITLESVKKDDENAVKAIRYEIEKARNRELIKWEYNIDRGTGMVTGATTEEMKGEN